MKEFWQWLKAVIIMIPVGIVVVIMGCIYYMIIPLPKEDSGARDDHDYLDHFDSI